MTNAKDTANISTRTATITSANGVIICDMAMANISMLRLGCSMLANGVMERDLETVKLQGPHRRRSLLLPAPSKSHLRVRVTLSHPDLGEPAVCLG